MTLKQEVREVLRHLVFDYTMEEINTETPFDQATTQILTKIKEKLPSVEAIDKIMTDLMDKQEVGCPGMFVYFADRDKRKQIAQSIIDRINK